MNPYGPRERKQCGASVGVFTDLVTAGNNSATAALSGMFRGSQLRIEPARMFPIAGIDRIQWLQAEGLVVRVGLYGSCSGAHLTVLAGETGESMARRLLGDLTETTAASARMMESSLAELGNIAACAFLGAIAQSAGCQWLPTPPEVLRGPLVHAVRSTVQGIAHPPIAGSYFSDLHSNLAGWFVFVADRAEAIQGHRRFGDDGEVTPKPHRG